MLRKTALYVALPLMIVLIGTYMTKSSRKRDHSNNKAAPPQIGANPVDEGIRQAYEKWQEHFRNSGIETTLACDVVGLFGALASDSLKNEWFDISSGGLEQRNADIYRLKESKYSADTLWKSFEVLRSNLDRTNKVKLAIVTDFGHEADDEAACIIADMLHKKGLVDVRFLFTVAPERFEQQKERLERWGGDGDLVFSLHDESQRDKFVDFLNAPGGTGKTVLLQLGPIHEPKGTPKWRPTLSQPHDYVLVGKLGIGANSKNDAKAPAEYLMSKAQTKIIVTDRSAFRFSYKALKKLLPSDPDNKDSLIGHVCKIGWRNLVGRASPVSGKYVAHLVSAPVAGSEDLEKDGGANYAAAKAVHDTLGKGAALNVPKGGKAEKLAKKYLDHLQHRQVGPPKSRLKVNADGSTNNPNGATAQSIVDGYAYILECLHTHFGVPYMLFESGHAEHWDAQWETPSLADYEANPAACKPFKRGKCYSVFKVF